MHCSQRLRRAHVPRVKAALRNSRGLTLVELMVTLAVLAILLSLAAPSFSSLLASTRMSSQTNEFMGTLNLARSEAVRRVQPVSLRASDSDNYNYSKGWTVFPDADGDGLALSGTNDADGKILREASAFNGTVAIRRVTRSAAPAPFTYTTSTDTDRMYLVFTSRGAIKPTTAAFFKVCDSAIASVKGRIVQVNAVGKISLDSTSQTCP